MPTGSNPAIAQQSRTISKGMSSNHRKHFGRGPTTVRTVIQKGFVISFLEGVYTPMERTLIEAGKNELVLAARFAYQETQRETFKSLVETTTGRKVRAFMSQNHIDPDIATEIFVLEPNGDEPSDTFDNTKNGLPL